MDALKELLPLAVNVSLILVSFSVGLDSSPAQALYVLKRPGLLLKALFSISVLVPLVAVIIVVTMPLTAVVKAGIILMAVSPLPPLALGKQIKLGGRHEYVYGLFIAVAACAVVVVPASVAVMSAVLPADATVSPAGVARVVLMSALIPVGLGVACNHFFPSASERLSPAISKFSTLLLLVGAVPILVMVWPAVSLLIGNGTLLAIAAVVVAGLISGHLIGGEATSDKVTLAFASATRHPGLALLIAHENMAGNRVMAAILLFTLTGLVVSVPYQIWCKRNMNLMPDDIRQRMD